LDYVCPIRVAAQIASARALDEKRTYHVISKTVETANSMNKQFHISKALTSLKTAVKLSV